MITIYNFQHGARGVRVAWLCEEMGLPYQPVILPYPTPAEYRAKYPPGSVPFIEDVSGVAMAESSAIMVYLMTRYGPTRLMPGDPATKARVLELVAMSEASLGASLNVLLTAKFGAPEGDRHNWTVAGAERAISRALDYIAWLKGERPYLAGETFSAADIAIATALSMWEGALGHAVPPDLADWLARVRQRPAYAKARAAFA